jgi:hypothetical protein
MRNFNPKVNTIYCDMDGVIADFDDFVLTHMGRTFHHADGPGADTAMWEFLKTIPHLYLQLKPTPYAKTLWDLINSYGADVQILTAIPRRSPMPDAAQDKRDWMAQHLSKDVSVNMGPYSADKWKHCTPGDILIDDREDNISDWVQKGKGIGILHQYKNPEVTYEALKLYCNS